MNSVTFTVNKSYVLNEVAKTTSYLGAKVTGEGMTYDRIFTTDEDRLMLERFWSEAANAATDLFKPFITSVSSSTMPHGIDISTGANYTATLSLSGSYDTNLTNSAASSLFSFFVNYIVSKWLRFIDKQEASDYGDQAVANLDDVRSKIYSRKKPTRSTPA